MIIFYNSNLAFRFLQFLCSWRRQLWAPAGGRAAAQQHWVSIRW